MRAALIRLDKLVATIAQQCNMPTSLIDYAPDIALQAAFGAYPPLSTSAADRAGLHMTVMLSHS